MVTVDRCLIAAILVIGAIQAYGAMDTLPTDGVAYLDLAGRLRDGDWGALLDRYWSPLYPFMLGVATGIVGGDLALEPRVAHAVNVGLFAVGVALFRGAVGALRLVQARTERQWIIDARTIHGTVILHALFACGALRFTNVGLVTPDLSVLVVLVGISRSILRARAGTAGRADDLSVGLLLAIGYAAKAAMLPISMAVLAAYGIARTPAGRAATARAAFVLIIVSTPYVVLLSRAEGRLTTGEAGPLNLAWYVGQSSSQIPDPMATGTEGIEHPWVRVVERPATYVFPEPRSGTYPAWSDPARWQRGLDVSITPAAVLRSLARQLVDYYTLFGAMVLGATLLVALHARRGAGDVPGAVALGVVAGSVVGLYAMVHMEPRFFGGVVIVAGLAVALACSAGGRTRWWAAIGIVLLAVVVASRWPFVIPSLREAGAGLAVAVAVGAWIWFRHVPRAPASVMLARTVALALLLAPVVGHVGHGLRQAIATARGEQVEPSLMVAEALRAAGIEPGTSVGSIGASTPAAWARRAGAMIVVEVAERDTDAFWRGSDHDRAPVLDAMTQAGAQAVIGRHTSEPGPGWRAVSGTNYWVLPLGASVSSR